MAISFQAVTDTSSSSSSTASTATSAINKDLNKNTFLQLLVAQLKYQDPMNPADGVQFLTQLTGFSQLEQTMQINEQVSDIQSLLADSQPTGDGTGTGSTPDSRQA
jgi:flagellar basal-body rod modification protein FlgD